MPARLRSQDDDDASARLQTVNEAFEDSALLRDVLLAVSREFGLTHASRCLQPAAEEPAQDAHMADAGSADPAGSEIDEDDAEESGGDDDDIWSAAERDDKDMMVSPQSSASQPA